MSFFYDFDEFCDKIDLPGETNARVKAYYHSGAFREAEPFLDAMCDYSREEKAREAFSKAVQDDEWNTKILTAHLECARRAAKFYEKKGISEEIYIHTMQYFGRIIRDDYKIYKKYVFLKAFWTGRQIGCVLFRIGEMEYEFFDWDLAGGKCLNLHVPSDADLTPEKLDESVRRARAFFAEFFPEYKDVPLVAESWLLSPELEKVLPDTSKILQFCRSFDILETMSTNSYFEWIYNVPKTTPLQDLPENTSLQRNLKQFLLSGNSFHGGAGVWNREKTV